MQHPPLLGGANAMMSDRPMLHAVPHTPVTVNFSVDVYLFTVNVW